MTRKFLLFNMIMWLLVLIISATSCTLSVIDSYKVMNNQLDMVGELLHE